MPPRSRKTDGEKMATPTPLTRDQIQRRLQDLASWSLVQGKLYAEFTFPDFISAFGFMTRVAIVAQAENHHPEWSNTYNKVRIHLTTHEAGGISERDFSLARRIDQLVG